MVKAMDTFCWDGTGMGTGMGGDYIDNLSPSFCFWLGLGLGLKLRFVNRGFFVI